jgi:hypothetical protein
MKQTSFALTCTLLLATFAAAHGNMEHVMGTVAEVSNHSISVKATDGATKVIEFDGKTKFLKGESPAAATDVHVGDRVVVHAHKQDTMLHAAEVKLAPKK